MSPSGRRDILRLAFGAAVLPLMASRAFATESPAGIQVRDGAIDPPARDMTFRRILRRDLAGGAAIIATRDFCVRFTSLPAGRHLVEGRQIAARVQAPDNLAALARLEETRIEIGGFPLTLDANGAIEPTDQTPPPNAVFTAALEDVRQRYGNDPDTLRDLIDAIRASSAQFISVPPPDLFAPVRAEVEDRRVIALPWGDSGEVHVRFSAVRNPETGLMRHATRDVTTSLLGETQRSSEQWELFVA